MRAPDHLAGFVALDMFGPGIPTGDTALGIEQVDGVVLHRLDESAELLFTGAQRLFRLLTIGHVKKGSDEADRFASAVHFLEKDLPLGNNPAQCSIRPKNSILIIIATG